VLPTIHFANLQRNVVSLPETDTSGWSTTLNQPPVRSNEDIFAITWANAEPQMLSIAGGALSGLGQGLGSYAGMLNQNEQNRLDRELTEEGYLNYLKRIREQGEQDRLTQELQQKQRLESGGALALNHLARTPLVGEQESVDSFPVEGGLYHSVNNQWQSLANNSQLHGQVQNAENENIRKLKNKTPTATPGGGMNLRLNHPKMTTQVEYTPVQLAVGRNTNQQGARQAPQGRKPSSTVIQKPSLGLKDRRNKSLQQRNNFASQLPIGPQPKSQDNWKGIKLNGPLAGVTLGDAQPSQNYANKLQAGIDAAQNKIQLVRQQQAGNPTASPNN